MLLARIRSFFWDTFQPEERAVLQVQLLVLLAINLLLSLGYYAQREWRRIADEHHLRLILRGWDGLAWYAWLAAAPAMVILIRRYPLVRWQLGRNIPRLLAGSALIYVAVTNLRFALRVLPDIWLPAAENVPVDWLTYVNTTLTLLPIDFLTYCGFFAISLAIDYYFKFRQRAAEALQLQLEAARLQFDLSQAELATLRNQLHPHFLFNSFNAIATLVRQKKNEAAVEMIGQLSELFRLALDRKGRQKIPLEEEMDFIRRYLAVERVRFGDKLQLEYAFGEEVLQCLVPSLLLQPLVENAIKHGIAQRTEPGRVRIAAHHANGRLALEISNDGPETPPAEERLELSRTGIGLANTRARLDRLYGSDYDLQMGARRDGGMEVRVVLPWRLGQAGIPT
jgi:hypothetical protein